VNFKNTVIVLTSNIGSEFIDRMSSIGFMSAARTTDNEKYAQVKDKVLGALKEYFRPEFLNRLDEIILFNVLSPEAVREIVGLQVKLVEERLRAKDISLTISEDVYTYLAKEGFNPQYGARPLKRLIQNKILNPVANAMINERMLEGGIVLVAMKDGEVFVTMQRKPGVDKIRTARARAKVNAS
ncbi:AAA family ATPase, partial [Candidatus Kaiserbacteria bacterium]|nr:AAA family ATPase [Candidatus Kaiserbacteria bacterium]